MKRGKDDWLDQKITEELLAMADEREKELQGIEMPIEKFADIKKEALRRRRELRRKRLRPRIAVASAAVLVLMLGVGAVGNRVYEPEIREYDSADGTTTRIENADSEFREYSEEEVCQDIEEKLGVVALRLGYEPQGMQLFEYWIDVETGEAVVKYKETANDELQIYISKNSREATVHFEMDGIERETVEVFAVGQNVLIYEYENPDGRKCFQSEFEMFDTYYCITGMIDLEEYKQMLENLVIKNA